MLKNTNFCTRILFIKACLHSLLCFYPQSNLPQVGSFISKTHEYEKGFKCEEQFYESLANSRQIISTLPNLNKWQFSKLVGPPPGHFWLPMHKEVPCLSQPQGQRMPTSGASA